MSGLISDFDKNIFFFFQGLQHPVMDCLLGWPTHLGATKILLVLVLLGILIFDRRGLKKLPAAAAGILLTSWTTELLKMVFKRARPHLFWEQTHVMFSKPGNHAFPSGHAAVMFAAAYILNYVYGKKMRWTYAAAVWVAFTRMYVGAHYPTDLIGGALWGTACAFLICRLWSAAFKTSETV